jgi:hypothetical protein
MRSCLIVLWRERDFAECLLSFSRRSKKEGRKMKLSDDTELTCHYCGKLHRKGNMVIIILGTGIEGYSCESCLYNIPRKKELAKEMENQECFMCKKAKEKSQMGLISMCKLDGTEKTMEHICRECAKGTPLNKSNFDVSALKETLYKQLENERRQELEVLDRRIAARKLSEEMEPSRLLAHIKVLEERLAALERQPAPQFENPWNPWRPQC